MTQQKQLSAVGFEPVSGPGAPTSNMLAEITSYLADRDLFGLIWCDDTLNVTHRFGKLADFIPLAQNICHALLPLMGFDDHIQALRRQPSRCVELPNISIRIGEETTPRLNINCYWISGRKQFLVVLSRVLRRSDLELELNNQIRAKRIAEKLVAEKSREVARINQDLTRMNGELEEFAYVISHDLKAPLRALRYISDDLEQSLPSGSGDAAQGDVARKHLEQHQLQLRRMSAMLDGLFEYATIGRRHEAVTAVDSRALVEEIIAALPLKGGMVVSVTGDLPCFNTLEQPLDLVLRNLIENALRHHDRERGHIEVRGHDGPDFLQITVSDDGPGIPADYNEAIFRPFLKVGQDDSSDSSGVGLALVRKTVDSVGGSIEVTSTGGRGASFRVCWPKTLRD